MNVFNSLGSNYDFSYVRKSLTKPNKKSLKNLKDLLEKKYKGRVVLTYKGRQAIELALKISKIEEGAKVAVTGFTCIAVIEAIEKNNLTPVYLDIDPKSLNFSSKELESKIKENKNIRAVIIQNTLGYPCDIENILRVCKKNKIVLIEDLAHSIGTVYPSGEEAGTVGDFVCLSFSQDKSIDAVSGGAIIIKNLKIKIKNYREETVSNSLDRVYPLLTWLIRKTYPLGVGKLLHFVFRRLKLLSDPMKNSSINQMSDWHASLALYGFKNLEKALNHRRKISKIYSENLPEKIISSEIPGLVEQGTNLRFPIFVEDRENLIKFLKSRGVHVSDIWYDGVVAPVKFLGLAKYPKHSCPNAEIIAEKILNLPTHINVSEKDALEISQLINLWIQEK